jgi:hypothetical protein
VDLPPDLGVEEAVRRYEASSDVKDAGPNFSI